MITLHEAYLKAKNEGGKGGRTRLSSCRDFGDFWGFDFTFPVKKEGANGFAYITLNKKTGELRYFNPATDIDLTKKAIPIAIEQFTEYNVAI